MNIRIVPKEFPAKVNSAKDFTKQLKIAKERKQNLAHRLHLKDVLENFLYVDLSSEEKIREYTHRAFKYLGIQIQNFQEEDDFQDLLDFKKVAEMLHEALKISHLSTLGGAQYGIETSLGVYKLLEVQATKIQKKLITPFLNINRAFLGNSPTIYELFSKMEGLAELKGDYPKWFQDLVSGDQYQGIQIPELVNKWSQIFLNIVEGFTAIDNLNQKYIESPTIAPLINYRIAAHNNMVRSLSEKSETFEEWQRKAQIVVKEKVVEEHKKQEQVSEILEKKLNGLADLRTLLETLRKEGLGEKYFKEVLKFVYRSKGFDDLSTAISSFFIKGGIKDPDLNKYLEDIKRVLKMQEENYAVSLGIGDREFLDANQDPVNEEKFFDYLAASLYMAILLSVRYRNFFANDDELKQAKEMVNSGKYNLDLAGDMKFTNSIGDLLKEILEMHNRYGKYES